MPLVLTFAACLAGFTAFFLGLALTLQGLLYNQPADRLPLRALVAGLLLATFLSGWAYLNTRASHKDKYGTLFEFSSTSRKEVGEFQAVRRFTVKDDKGQLKEVTVPHLWRPGGGPNGGDFVEVETQKPFARSTSGYITTALIVNEQGAPRKFAARAEGIKYLDLTEANRNLVFQDEAGPAFISDQNLRYMEVPSTSGLLVVVLLNVAHFAVWFLAFWPVLRFRVGISLGLTALFGGVAMFILMPLLFSTNVVKPAPLVARAA